MAIREQSHSPRARRGRRRRRERSRSRHRSSSSQRAEQRSTMLHDQTKWQCNKCQFYNWSWLWECYRCKADKPVRHMAESAEQQNPDAVLEAWKQRLEEADSTEQEEIEEKAAE